MDDNTLYDEFKEYPDLAGARVVTDKETGRARGFGYVEFLNPEAAEAAHAGKNGASLDNRAMNIDFATKRPNNNNEGGKERNEDRAQKYGDTISPESETLFVGNIAFEVSEEEIAAAFGEVAPVQSVRLPTDM